MRVGVVLRLCWQMEVFFDLGNQAFVFENALVT